LINFLHDIDETLLGNSSMKTSQTLNTFQASLIWLAFWSLPGMLKWYPILMILMIHGEINKVRDSMHKTNR